VKELVRQLAEMECSLEKCSREKTSVTAELEAARSQLNCVVVDYSKVPANMPFTDKDGHLTKAF